MKEFCALQRRQTAKQNSLRGQMESGKEVTYLPVFGITIAFTIALSYAIVSLDIDVIKKNWDTKRCSPSVLLTGWLYAPQGEDPSTFATDNFGFCVKQYVDDALSVALQPIKTLFGKQLYATSAVQGNLNTLRGSSSGLMSGFTKLFEPLFNKFQVIQQLVVQSFVRFKYAMARFSAIFTSLMFAGLSSIKVVENSMNFVIRVVIIILSILVALFILLFFVLFPFVPTILTTIGIISATAFGGAVGGMASTFCVPPGTLVRCDGSNTWKPVESLEPGDALSPTNHVEGVIVADGSHTPFVSIQSCAVGAGHLVWDSNKRVWCSAENHSAAKPISERYERVYCLNTSEHTWTIKSTLLGTKEGELLLRDWEELPEEMGSSGEWERLVSTELQCPVILAPATGVSEIRGLLGPETSILTRDRGPQAISDIRVGDSIQDFSLGVSSWTTVSAIIRDNSEETPCDGPNAGCWMRGEMEDSWIHPNLQSIIPTTTILAFNLITESGTFCTVSGFYLRDFSEMGMQTLDTYRPWIVEKLNSIKIEA